MRQLEVGPGRFARHVIGCRLTRGTRVQNARRRSMTWRASSARPFLVVHVIILVHMHRPYRPHGVGQVLTRKLLVVGPGRHRSPRHRTQCNSTQETRALYMPDVGRAKAWPILFAASWVSISFKSGSLRLPKQQGSKCVSVTW